MRGLKRPGCPGGWDPHQRPSHLQERKRVRKKRTMMRMKRRCSVMPAYGPTAPPQMIVSLMPPDYSLPPSPARLKRGRHHQPLQHSPLLLLCHPCQHPHWVPELLHLQKSGCSQSSAGHLKQPSRLRPWPALGVRPSLLQPRPGMRTLHRLAPRELGKLPKES